TFLLGRPVTPLASRRQDGADVLLEELDLERIRRFDAPLAVLGLSRPGRRSGRQDRHHQDQQQSRTKPTPPPSCLARVGHAGISWSVVYSGLDEQIVRAR